MTPLPDALALAAELLPERFLIRKDERGNEWHCAWLDAGEGFTGHFEIIYTLSRFHEGSSKHGLIWLEAACREECEARGWPYQTGRDPFGLSFGEVFGHRVDAPVSQPDMSIAHALLLALVAAVKGEGG